MQNKTDFFTKISPILVGGLNLTLTLKKVGDQITVATRPQRPDVKDKNDVLSKIQPLVITETAEALDDGYVDTITQAAEPVNSIADGLKEFNKSVDAAKKAASTKKSAPKKAATSKAPAKAKSPSRSKLSPEEQQAKKQKEADAKKAAEIKIMEQKRSSATNFINAKKYRMAQPFALAGEKLWKAKKYQPGEGDADYGSIFADLFKQAESGLAEVDRAEGMRKAAKPMSDARKLFTSMNMPEAAKNLKAVYKLVPDHADALALTKEVVEKFGQTVYDQLMEK